MELFIVNTVHHVINIIIVVLKLGYGDVLSHEGHLLALGRSL